MSLIEVLVSGAMTIIIAMGVATMMQNSFKEQRRVIVLDTLRNQKSRIETMIRDQSIWNAIMANNTGGTDAGPLLTNLRAGVSAAQIVGSSAVKFKIYNSDNSLAYNLLAPTDTTGPYNGFTEKGAACANFYATAGAGRDECPFSYRLLISATCASGASCTNPQLKLVARLLFNPSTTGSLASLVNLVSPVAGTDISDSVQDSKYDAVVKRTSTAVNRSFRMVTGFTPGATGSTCGGNTFSGAGQCSVGARAIHATASTYGWFDTTNGGFDTYDLVTTVAGGQFRFNETGYYGCIISVPAFATAGFQATLYDVTNTTVISTASVTAGQWVQATAVIDAKFNVRSTATVYEIDNQCDAAATGGIPAANNCTLGFATSPYPGTTFTTIVAVSCYKIDRAL